MAFVQDRVISTGDLIQGSFTELAPIRREIGIYLGGFAAFSALGWSIGSAGFLSLVGIATYLVAQYWLYRMMLQKSGMLREGRWLIPGFAGMAVMIGLAVLIGANFFIIPGIILAAKWVMAPTMLVAGGRGVFSAMGESWAASQGNTPALSIATFVMALIAIAAYMALAALAALFGRFGFMGMAVSGLAVHILPLLMMGLSMHATRRLSGDVESVADIFA